MKPQQGRTARCILWALGFPLALWLAAALADAFSGGASLSRVLARFSVCMNAPFSVRWTEDTGRFLLLAGLLYPAGPWPWNPGAATAVRAKNTAAPGGETRGPSEKSTGTGGTGRKTSC